MPVPRASRRGRRASVAVVALAIAWFASGLVAASGLSRRWSGLEVERAPASGYAAAETARATGASSERGKHGRRGAQSRRAAGLLSPVAVHRAARRLCQEPRLAWSVSLRFEVCISCRAGIWETASVGTTWLHQARRRVATPADGCAAITGTHLSPSCPPSDGPRPA